MGSDSAFPENVNGLLLDLSGVLYEDDSVLPGAAETVAAARDRGLVLRFVTNTATKPATAILDRLDRLGIRAQPDELFTAPRAARAWLEAENRRPFCLIHEALRGEFADLDQSEPDAVLLGDARDDLSYANLNEAFRLCQAGAPLIGIGMNRYFKGSDGLMLDAGPFIRAVAWAADTEPVIMGKPGKAFFDQVVASTGLQPDACLMVGDDREGDVIGAHDAGLQACLVRTGKFQAGDEADLPGGVGVIDGIGSLFT
ncbi:MAG: TIGR01458 family HAD-type hydrolase [Opitutales bacterium]